jgi:hypothetical protein
MNAKISKISVPPENQQTRKKNKNRIIIHYHKELYIKYGIKIKLNSQA